MNAADALRNVSRLFLDTAPVIYYVETNPSYIDRVEVFFDRIEAGTLTAVTSPITLAECLVMPFRTASIQLQQDFFSLIVFGDNTLFAPIDQECARRAAQLRAHYNLTLTDALQVAAALETDCDAFLTNDTNLKRVAELKILALDELTLT